jgi:hypothetical protein
MSFSSDSSGGGGNYGPIPLPAFESLSQAFGGKTPGKKPKQKSMFATFLGGDMSSNPSAASFGPGGGTATLLGQ